MKKLQEKSLAIYALIAVIACLLFLIGAVVYKNSLSQSIRMPDKAKQTSGTPMPVIVEPLTEDEKDVLTARSASQTAAQRKKYAEAIASLVKKEKAITIKECMVAPAIAEPVDSTQVIFRNHDDTERTIAFDPQHTYIIPAKSDRTISLDFAKPQSFYPYGCDSQPEPVGGIYRRD